eukprot:TRINITY_DN3212_c0_g2_i1.p1 TRINITY_DN3212_c0_g2~~TRINITY_DN3212_c0_g2_i1.p1  ORF type:complete len:543 (+),score=312.26 TRINITY_DN3212_c0_g2_i1:87-1715(+)
MSDEHKARGNEAFSAKNFPVAIEHFTKGIEVDSSNHVLYSNRSAAYASLGAYSKALEDAKLCVELKRDWPKGYSRLGAALQGLRKYDEAIAAYNQGLQIDPSNASLQQGIAQAEKVKATPPHPLAAIFTPQLFTALATMPSLRELRDDQEFTGILSRIIEDHSLINNYLGDPRVMKLIQSVTRMPGSEEEEAKPAPKKAPEPEPVKELTPEEKEAAEKHKQAEELKQEGNKLYKAKKFEEAISFYNKALDVEPNNIQYMNNIAAVHLEQKDYEKCIEMCDKAYEVGKEHRADFKDIGKALTRKGTCYHKQKDYDNAIVWFKKSSLENRSADTLDKLNKCEAEKKKAADEAYFSEEKSEESRLLGNEKFKAQQYKEAIDLYHEAIKRNPKAHAVYSNRAAAYMKMGAYDDAEKDCNTCLKLEPTFVKAVTRLGHIYFFRKEYHKAMVQYQKGVDMDPTNEECRNGKDRTVMKIQEESGGAGDEQRAQRAMADPEIQQILGDSYMQQVLREIQENPRNLNHYMQSKDVMGKINKLIAAGIIRTS